VFGLLRVVGSLLAQQLPPGLPIKMFALASIANVDCGFRVLPTYVRGIVPIDKSCFRLVSITWHQMNVEADSLPHIVNTCIDVVAH
jgi:hypothetical protein